jgi:wyosine [tRNA(Phe)-imidazoG37] synthetase (radical SAM superfamily)
VIVAKRRLSTVDHAADVVGMTYVYPVVSRRAGGVSLGINLNPNNACNWRCGYCQVQDLVLGAGPAIELGRLEEELRAMLDDIVNGDFLGRSAPEGARVLKDVAFAGNGEPTTCPDFAGAVQVVERVLGEVGLRGKIPVVLISNGSQVKKPEVIEGLRRLADLHGEVWFKLDAATAEGMERINQSRGDPAAHLAKLRSAAALCPTWIQTCLVAWDGQPPSEAEQAAYLAAVRGLAEDRVPLRGVLLYTMARLSKQPDAARVSALPAEWLRAFGAEIEAAGLPVKVSV